MSICFAANRKSLGLKVSSTDLLYGLRLERRDALARNGDQKTAPALQLDRQRGGRNRDSAIFPAYLERQPRLQSGLPPNLLGNDQPSRAIDGRFHGIKRTITFTISQAKRGAAANSVRRF